MPRAHVVRTFAKCAVAAGAIAACAPAATRGHTPAPPRGEALAAYAALLRLEDRRAYDSAALAGFAGSLSPEVRRRAALAIGRIGDARGRTMLQGLARDADTAVAATAAFALGELGDTLAVPLLAALAAPARAAGAPTVVGEAAAALGKVRSDAGRRALEELLNGSAVESALPAALGPALLAIWKYPARENRPIIERWTAAPDPELRWRAAYALYRRPDPAAVRTLLALATDPDERVRAFALRGLAAPLADSAGVARTSVLPRLIAALHDPAYAVRVDAARVLGSYPEPAAVAALLPRVTGDEAHLALAATAALGRIGPPASATAPALERVAADSAAPVQLRTTALAALTGIEPSRAARLAAAFAAAPEWRLRAAAGEAYAGLGRRPDSELDALLRDADARVVNATLTAAVTAAGDTAESIRRWLVESIEADDPVVRAAALGGLAKLRDPSLFPLLMDAYDRARADSLNDAAIAALQALGELRRANVPVSRAFFVRFPRSDDYVVRRAAVEVFGDTAIRAWGPALPLDDAVTPAAAVSLSAAMPRPRALIVTERGEMEVELWADRAPLTVANFVRLAHAGYFAGQEWPRVVPDFVIQGGDPRGDTSGGPGYSIRDEINRGRYLRGTVGMALAGPDTGGSQFFVTHSPQPHLDGGYTTFGEVTRGMEVAERLLVGDRIVRIDILNSWPN